MTAIDNPLQAILDHPLAGCAGGGALGYVGLDIPPDLLLAAPSGCCHLPWRVSQHTPVAEQWLESTFPIWARTVLEDWAAGRFDCFAQVVFTRGEDVSQRLYYYVCELQRLGKLAGPRPRIFDIARIERASSQRYTESALRALATELQLSSEQLRDGIVRANELRALFAQWRVANRSSGSRYERLVRASLYADVRPLGAGWEEAPPAFRGRLLLAGSSPPDDRIHRCVESRGWLVAQEYYGRDLCRLGEPVDPAAADPIAAIARGWLRQRFLIRDAAHSAARLLERVSAARADAVLLWCAREDEALVWQVPALKRALQERGIASLILGARSWDFEDGAAEEVQAFLEGLRP